MLENTDKNTDKPKRKRENHLNDLSSKEWIKFQKSWFMHNPPPRKRSTLLHPAKFPEALVAEFIRFFTKKGQLVLDPMVGTGSTVVAAIQTGRIGIGIELQEKFAQVAREQIEMAKAELFEGRRENPSKIIVGNALNFDAMDIPPVDYVITSPPYWDMLHRGGKFRLERGNSSEKNPIYSNDADDLGNIDDYEQFIDLIETVYRKVHAVMRDKAYMTIIVKNIKKGGRMYPLAWDIGSRLSKFMTLKDEKIWCQDNQRLAPFGMFNAWVSNTFHNYCLQFRKE